MKRIRLALGVIGIAYLLLGLVVVYFAVSLGRSPDAGAAYLAVGILAWGGTIAAAGLLAGSVLGTIVLVRHADTRRTLYVLAILSAWIGALLLGWLAWEFWTHSSLPQLADCQGEWEVTARRIRDRPMDATTQPGQYSALSTIRLRHSGHTGGIIAADLPPAAATSVTHCD